MAAHFEVNERMRESIQSEWRFPPGVTYLNHGSFGPAPQSVESVRLDLLGELNRQPMDFFVGGFEERLAMARRRLAHWLGSAAENFVFVENATYAMNLVATGFRIEPDEHVLLTDHEYGAVHRIWSRWIGEERVRTAAVRLDVESDEQLVDELFGEVREQTKLLVVSHITSATAAVLPVEQICRRAQQQGLAVCVDGPHGVAQFDLNLDRLGCDYYTASCHKWLSAPFGSGFLYARPNRQSQVLPIAQSWGRLYPELLSEWNWDDEFVWTGTRDPTPLLTIPAAIDFLAQFGFAEFREQCVGLAQYAQRRIDSVTGLTPPRLVVNRPSMMALCPLPPGDQLSFQRALRQRFGIAALVTSWNGLRFLRVSCHLYNDQQQIDRLADAVRQLL